MHCDMDWETFIRLQKDGKVPKVTIPISLNTPYLQKEIQLDLLIWNLSEENQEITKKVVDYVLRNFSKLFETAWTVLYHQLCDIEYCEVVEHTLEEFYKKQIDLEYPYNNIQVELNCKLLKGDVARYCFIVPTDCHIDWAISDDDMRIYMEGNKAKSANTNNDDMQMLEDDYCRKRYYEEGAEGFFVKYHGEMDAEGFQYAEAFTV